MTTAHEQTRSGGSESPFSALVGDPNSTVNANRRASPPLPALAVSSCSGSRTRSVWRMQWARCPPSRQSTFHYQPHGFVALHGLKLWQCPVPGNGNLSPCHAREADGNGTPCPHPVVQQPQEKLLTLPTAPQGWAQPHVENDSSGSPGLQARARIGESPFEESAVVH